MTASVLLLMQCLAAAPSSEVRLRNVAAAEAATAINSHAARQRLDVAAISDPCTNTVRLTGGPLGRRHGRELLARLDVPAVQVMAKCLFVEVPYGFTKLVGLDDGLDPFSELSVREMRMLTAAYKREKGISVISRPVMSIADGQTGLFQVGDERSQLALRVTPRIDADGSMATVRYEIQHSYDEKPVVIPGTGLIRPHSVENRQTTVRHPFGKTQLIRMTLGDRVTELHACVTLERVESQSR